MCGIAGIIGSEAQPATLEKMLVAQAHRGPDATGRFVEKDVCLGHNRLAIIDLSKEANQPFYSTDQRHVLIFNGEIYNYLELKKELDTQYAFQTSSDTEVVLAAYLHWGELCLHKFNGMFSFAIWDRKEQSLFAARDRFGVKPFYYSIESSTLYLASELKALFAAGVKKAPKESVWASYFAYGSYGAPTECFWEGIHQLAGGYYLTYKNDVLATHRWYVFEEELKKYQKQLPYDEVKARYKALLEDSINLRFRADVPVGFNVSGGLDSSALLALVNQRDQGGDIRAYTFYTGDERYDELPWVEDLIATTQNPLSKVLVTSQRITALSEHMAVMQDEPYGGVPTVAYAEIFKQARKDGIRVLLDGQGMDEQWAGYDYYIKQSEETIQGVRASPFRSGVLQDFFLAKATKPQYPKPFKDALLNKQYRDLFYTKIPRALRFNDRVSMAASTELREPFLDYRLVEFAFAQPLEYKIKDGVQKYLLRDLVSDYVPTKLTYAPKRPLQTPQREWLAGALTPWVVEAIEQLGESSWFDKKALIQEMQNYFKGDQDSSFHIWQWVNARFLLYKNPSK